MKKLLYRFLSYRITNLAALIVFGSIIWVKDELQFAVIVWHYLLLVTILAFSNNSGGSIDGIVALLAASSLVIIVFMTIVGRRLDNTVMLLLSITALLLVYTSRVPVCTLVSCIPLGIFLGLVVVLRMLIKRRSGDSKAYGSLEKFV